MRITRNKHNRRIMRFFRISFGVKEPYHVLIDGTFITHALNNKIHIREQLPKIFDGRATPMVTQCVLAELRSLGPRAVGAVMIAKGYYRIKCGHDTPVPASECMSQQIGLTNERNFLVATQDVKLIKSLRKVPGVPLLRLQNQVPQLEDPSKASRSSASTEEAKKMAPAEWEKPQLPELKQKLEQIAERAAKPKKKRGPKGANPLSCKKPQKRKAQQLEQEPSKQQDCAQAAPPCKRVRSRRMGTIKPADIHPDAALPELRQSSEGTDCKATESVMNANCRAEPEDQQVKQPKGARSRHASQRRKTASEH